MRALLNRRHFAGLAASPLVAWPDRARGTGGKRLIVTEPVHGLASLPLYVAIRGGAFAREDLDVQMLAVSMPAAHVAAVASGQAFAFVGGPEHCALANRAGASLRAVASVVDRAAIYIVGDRRLAGRSDDLAGALRGRAIAGGANGGAPQAITRFICLQHGLQPGVDVTIVASAQGTAMAAMNSGQVQLATVNEPLLARGIALGLWGEPLLNGPGWLGPYAFATLNVDARSIERDPATVQSLVRGLLRGIEAMRADPAATLAVARLEFPDVSEDALKAALARGAADSIWSADGCVGERSWNTMTRVVQSSGPRLDGFGYGDLVNNTFVGAG